MAERNMVEAVNDAMMEEMRRDDRVIVMGEDVGEGGVFRSTQGLLDEFGADRCIDTPLAESAIVGVAIGAPSHPQSIEAIYGHVPGLKVVCVATPYDAKGLLKSAVRDPDPVIFLEHKRAYRLYRQELPDEDYTIPIGKAEVKREGKDITLITYGMMLHHSLKAAEAVEAEDGVSVEVI